VCPYVGSNTLVFWGVWESIEVCHSNSYVSARGLEHLLVPHHVESTVEVVWDQLLLFFICPSPSVISIALFALLPLLIYFSIKDWFVVANMKTKSPHRGGKTGKWGKPGGCGRRSMS